MAGEGHAINPLFGTDHRPAPVIATAMGGDTWSVDIAEDFGYRLIAEIGGKWQELSAGYFPAGERELTVFGATRVELLADRRPIDAADFNGDGLVNALDYAIWRDAADSTGSLTADANGDGTVNRLDYDLWSGGYALPSNATAVPEPSSILMVGFALLAQAMRTTKARRTQR